MAGDKGGLSKGLLLDWEDDPTPSPAQVVQVVKLKKGSDKPELSEPTLRPELPQLTRETELSQPALRPELPQPTLHPEMSQPARKDEMPLQQELSQPTRKPEMSRKPVLSQPILIPELARLTEISGDKDTEAISMTKDQYDEVVSLSLVTCFICSEATLK